MALRFSCERCKAEIIVSHLKVGEQALCRACGSPTTVPRDATETSQKPTYQIPVTSEQVGSVGTLGMAPLAFAGKKAWNPKGIHWMAWLLSPLPAGITWALNYGKLGRPEKKLGALLIAIALSAALIVINLIPDFPRQASILVNGCCASIYYYTQKDLFQKFMEQGGEKASFVLPVANSVAFLVLLFGIAYGVLKYQENNYEQRLTEISDLLTDNRLTAAKAKLSELRDDFPEELAPYVGLTLVYLGQSHIDSALISISRALEIAPLDSDVVSWRHLALSYHYEHQLQYDSAVASLDSYLNRFPQDAEEAKRRELLHACVRSVSSKEN